MRVPEELALVGDDDRDLAGDTAVPLTSVRQPSLLIGRTVRASSTAVPPTRDKE